MLVLALNCVTECQVKPLNTPGISYNEIVMKKFKRATSGYLLSY